MKITMAHGAGGRLTDELIREVFVKNFSESSVPLEDAAVLDLPSRRIAYTTDSFVVTPLFFPGGDIGRLAVCGTVNDLLTRGAAPKYLSAGFILEEGLDIDALEKAVRSMAETAREAGVKIVTGDTKVIEGRGGMYINTSGIGVMEGDTDISARRAVSGDAVIISGDVGCHHACILSARMEIENGITSDCAPLNGMVAALLSGGVAVHVMRDVTRGGFATVLNEIAAASGVGIALSGEPLTNGEVQGFCDILGLDPLYMGCEGVMAVILPESDAERAVDIIRTCRYGENARITGKVTAGTSGVTIKTRAGGHRIIGPLIGEGLPRIC